MYQDFPTISSLSNLTSNNDSIVSFDKLGYQILDNHRSRTLLKHHCKQGLYIITKSDPQNQISKAFLVESSQSTKWHQRIGHPHGHAMSLISLHNHFLNIPTKLSLGHSCIKSKTHKSPFPISTNHQYKLLELNSF